MDPTDRIDLITMLAQGEDTKDMVSRPLAFLSNIMLLIVGGNDTTRNSISGGGLALNKFPAEYKKLRADQVSSPDGLKRSSARRPRCCTCAER